MKLEDLRLYERAPDDYYGKDKDGNEYGIFSDGDINPIEKGTIEPHWYHATINEVKTYIERHKKADGKEIKKSFTERVKEKLPV